MRENTSPSKLENIFGWVGTIMLLVAYSFNALGFILANSILYITLNIFGGVLVMYIAYRYHNYQSTLINLVWFIVAIIALSKFIN